MTATHVKTLVVISVILATALGGCSLPPPAASEPSIFSTQSESSDPTNTVERWAGLVAEQVREFDRWTEDWDRERCIALSADILCSVMLTTVSFMVQTAHIKIAAPSDPASLTYIGTPPAEIQALYKETTDVTERAADAGETYLDCDSDCTAEAIDLERAVDALQTKFAAWSPYL